MSEVPLQGRRTPRGSLPRWGRGCSPEERVARRHRDDCEKGIAPRARHLEPLEVD